jgi:N-acetylglutamate synthase-like GNAT family acetyltransferase
MHNPTDSHLSNYNMIKLRNDEVIAFGSILVSSQIGLGYLHNMGTAAAHRHQGHFLDCITQLTEKAEQHGVDTVYAQAEQGEASYHGFLKAGFTQDETYQMWYNR